MKMRKMISKILAIVLVFSLSFGIFGNHEYVMAEDQATIHVETVEAEPGDIVTVSIKMENNPGIIAAEMKLCYDDGLSLVEITEGELSGTYTYNKNKYSSPYKLLWESDDFDVDVTTSGVFVKATFLVKEEAKAGTTHKVWIEYEEDLIFNAAMDNVHFEIVEGGVSIPASACVHSYTNYVSNNDATCEADGTKTATCDKGCGNTDTIQDEGSKKGHSFTTYVSNNDATCEADGTKTAVCDNGCGKTDTIADAGTEKGHSFTTYVSNNDATCEADGTKTAVCDNGCGKTDTIADNGSKKGHKFTNYTSNNDATYFADGTETATCDNGCGKTDTRTDEESMLIDTIAPNGEIKIGENTWKKVLNTITFGIFFKDTFDVTITGADHETGVNSVEYYKANSAVTDVTTITEWTTYEKFSVASEGEYVIYAKITDNSGNVCYISTDGLVLDVTKPVISGVVANGEYCDDVVIKVTDAYAMDVTVNGEVVSLEANSNYTLEAVNANGTEYTVVATDKAGNATIVVVTVYKGHQFVNYVSNNDATCTKDGTETGKCKCCDETDTRTEAGSKIPHKYVTYVSNNDATCQKDGTKTATCEYGCGTKDTVVDAGSKTAHIFTDYVSNNDATCQKDGTKTATCEFGCGTKDTVTDANSKVDHIYKEYVENNDATCQKNETKTAACEFGCGKTNTVEIPDSTVEHKYTTYVSNNDATCKENGTKTAECDFNCGTQSTIEDEGTILDHEVEEWIVTKEPTLDEFGEKEGVCILCKETIKMQIEKLIQNLESENGTKLECGEDVAFDADTKFNAEVVTDEIPEQTIETHKQEIDKLVSNKSIAEIWDLSLTLNDEEIALSGPVTITISINPELLEKYTALQVICIDEDGNYILLDSEVVENAATYSLRSRATSAAITFTTDTMGTFILVGEEIVVDDEIEDDKNEADKNEDNKNEDDKNENVGTEDGTEDDDTTKTPQTGDNTSFVFVMVLLFMAAFALMLSSKLKYQSKTK